MTIREQIEDNERRILSKYASFACASKEREKPLPDCPVRTAYMRDRDRIIHCKAFRRLKHKTQMFITPEKDHYRTRLTHTLEVSQISRTVARAMGLNEDLTEAIALAHDLGHTPFGHAGEDALTQVSGTSFRHNEQSVRIVRLLERNGDGLNLTPEVLDGILHHTGSVPAQTLEGQVVAIADRIAYINHDIDDSLRAGVLKEEDIPKSIRDVLGVGHGTRINTLVSSMVEYGVRAIEQEKPPFVGMKPEIKDAMEALRKFMFSNIYRNPVVKGEENKGAEILKRLYEYYIGHCQEMPMEYQAVALRDGGETAALDYVACMTDRYAVNCFVRLFIPKGWNV